MNRYRGPVPFRPWWARTPAILGALALVALLSAMHIGLGLLAMIAAIVAVWMLAPWHIAARIGATLGAFVLLSIGAGATGQLDEKDKDKTATASAESSHTPGTTPPASPIVFPSATPPVPIGDFVGQPLDAAEQQASSSGYAAGHHDASDEHRQIPVTAEWTVCFQRADDTARTVEFAAVRKGEPCTKQDGGPLWPLMPAVVGSTYNAAVETIKQAGIDPARVTVDDVYLDVAAPSAAEVARSGDEWRVCFQQPSAGEKVLPAAGIHLDLGRWTGVDLVRSCPAAKDTTYKIPANDPSYPKDKGKDTGKDTNTTTGGGGSTTGGGTGGTSSTTGGSTATGGSSSTGGAGTGGSAATGGTGTSTGGSTSATGGSTGNTSTTGGTGTTGGGNGSTGGGSVGSVHPGAFCAPAGATGVSSTGKPMVCGPASDGRNRWHSP
ncbi:hypothetical protein LO772_35290 [Yinghuangia sp. ASG 101]|uniref:hypothetical protein n=1 Tax=Yinghuangia sp. ASG 101 TaxID=2896848 RepID=UPI001E4BACBD|nr:hypothetical protein [Yinghuangia sp. ASG 101]UGQ11963.1 hypothetical protein LO772_35290 [Yinghuangia sp. ASG 101]